MENWAEVAVTASGSLAMASDETLYETIDDVTLYDGDSKTSYVRGALYVTSHRLVWRHAGNGSLLGVQLSKVANVDTETVGMIRRNTKVVLHFPAPVWVCPVCTLHNEASLVACGACGGPRPDGVPIEGGHTKIKCETGGKEAGLFQHVTKQLAARPWLAAKKEADAKKQQAPAAFSTRTAGIGGLIRRQDRAQRQNAQLASQAFTDLDGLMGEATKMVKLIERYSEEQKREEAAAAAAGGGPSASGKEEEKQQLDSLLQQVGIANPVTKQTAGSRYREELARQLADFLVAPLDRAGGMLALTDIYCMFNRARGTELISPDDLLQACEMLGGLGLPMRLRAFESGVKVVQSASHSDARVAERVKELVVGKGHMTAGEFATAARVSFSVAKQQLYAAEQCGAVCRDDSFEGLQFYPNLFAELGQGTRETAAISN